MTAFAQALAKRLNRRPPGARTDRWYSQELLAGLDPDPSHWYGDEDDFTKGLATAKYTVTQATTGTFALGDGAGGVALLDCDSSTVAQGVNVQQGGTAGEWAMPAAGRTIIWSSRLKFVDTASGPEFFIGLHETDTSIIAASALSGDNMVGFSSVTDNKVLLATSEKATVPGTTTGHTMVEDTYALLEFKITGVTLVEFFVNGTKVSSLATTYIPIVEMRPSFVCQSDGAVDTIVHIDNWGCWVSDVNLN